MAAQYSDNSVPHLESGNRCADQLKGEQCLPLSFEWKMKGLFYHLNCGAQNWTQYSRYGLIKAEQNGTIAFLDWDLI